MVYILTFARSSWLLAINCWHVDGEIGAVGNAFSNHAPDCSWALGLRHHLDQSTSPIYLALSSPASSPVTRGQMASDLD